MYFEPDKKTYYRFPSTKSVIEMDNRMYFPESPIHSYEDAYYDYSTYPYMPEREHSYDFK